MKNNIISIIVPIYNTEQYLSKCIESLINQTYKNLEILLIDDNSPDNCKLICNEYKRKDPRIKYYKKENSGVSDTRNYGLRKATGDYITFVDSDDWLDKATLEDCMRIISEKKVDILRFSYTKEYGKISKQYKYSVPTEIVINKKDYEELLYNHIFDTFDLSNSCNCIFKSDIIKGIYFDKQIKNGEDFKFMVDALIKSNSIYFINNPYYHYYYNINSATNNVKKDKLQEKIIDISKAYRYILNKLPSKDIYAKKMNERIKNTILSIQSQASNLSFKEYYEFLKKIDELLTEKNNIFNINKSQSNYLCLKFKNKIKNIIKRLINLKHKEKYNERNFNSNIS